MIGCLLCKSVPSCPVSPRSSLPWRRTAPPRRCSWATGSSRSPPPWRTKSPTYDSARPERGGAGGRGIGQRREGGKEGGKSRKESPGTDPLTPLSSSDRRRGEVHSGGAGARGPPLSSSDRRRGEVHSGATDPGPLHSLPLHQRDSSTIQLSFTFSPLVCLC